MCNSKDKVLVQIYTYIYIQNSKNKVLDYICLKTDFKDKVLDGMCIYIYIYTSKDKVLDYICL